MPSAKRLENLESQLSGVRFRLDGEKYARDPVAFAEGVLGMTLDPWQREVVAGLSKRDILNCCRQAGKSTTASVIALHEALYRPRSLTILVSPSQRQSSELFRKVVELRESLPDAPTLSEDNRLSMTVQGGGRIVSLPGSEATIRGYSAPTLIIEDEAARVPDDLYYSVRPMLATSNGRLVLMSTPWGKRGHFFDTWQNSPGWSKIAITAEQVPRIPPEFLEEERATHTEAWMLQEYYNVFLDSERALFSYDLVMGVLNDELAPLFWVPLEISPEVAPGVAPEGRTQATAASELVVAVDLAQTHDFTAISVHEFTPGERQGSTQHAVRHLERLPLGTAYPEQVERIAALVERVGACELVVDQTGVGRPVVDMLRGRGLSPQAITITAGDNVSEDVFAREYRVPKRELVSTLQVALQTKRFQLAASLAEAKRWADEMLAFQVELTATGHDKYGNDESMHKHDDLVIATALGVWWAQNRKRPRIRALT
jgi:hypothetical protein